MRSKIMILAATGPANSLLCTAPRASPDSEETSTLGPLEQDFRGEVISGCGVGSPLVKKMIILTPGGSAGCQVRHVVPPGVCVVPGGVIRWRVVNSCGYLEGTEEEPALEISGLRLIHPDGTTEPASWLDGCRPVWLKLDNGTTNTNLLFCDVPDDTTDGVYKYDIKGKDVDAVDPWIEVRRGG